MIHIQSYPCMKTLVWRMLRNHPNFPTISRYFLWENMQMRFVALGTKKVHVMRICMLLLFHSHAILMIRHLVRMARIGLLLKIFQNKRGRCCTQRWRSWFLSSSLKLFKTYYLPSLCSPPPQINSSQQPQTLICTPLGLWVFDDSGHLKDNTTSQRTSCFFLLEQQHTCKQ